MPWIIDEFQRKRCQKKRKDVSHQFLSEFFSKIFCCTWMVGCQKFVQYRRMEYSKVDSCFCEALYVKILRTCEIFQRPQICAVSGILKLKGAIHKRGLPSIYPHRGRGKVSTTRNRKALPSDDSVGKFERALLFHSERARALTMCLLEVQAKINLCYFPWCYHRAIWK